MPHVEPEDLALVALGETLASEPAPGSARFDGVNICP